MAIFWRFVAMLVISAVVSRVTAPKPQTPKPGVAEVPVAEEGRKVIRIYGTRWRKDAQILGFKQTGSDRIRSKGGKK